MGYHTLSKSNIRNLFSLNFSAHNCRVKCRHLDNWVWSKLMMIHEKTIRCINLGNWWKWRTLQTVFWLWMANSREMKRWMHQKEHPFVPWKNRLLSTCISWTPSLVLHSRKTMEDTSLPQGVYNQKANRKMSINFKMSRIRPQIRQM